ncbi:MAG: magnesium transporter [Gemmatimonadetes bacterium]|nr:magnesium transporter [Gemmatimonadota bacterium]
MSTAHHHDEDTESQRLEHLESLLEEGDLGAVREYLSSFPHASDVADLLEGLGEESRGRAMSVLAEDPVLAAEALAEMEWEEHPEESLAALEPEQIAAVVAELSDDDAADIIGEMGPEDRDRVLAALSTQDAGDIRDLMRYHDESAGGIMTTEVVAILPGLTAAAAVEEIRRQAQDVESFYSVFVVAPDDRLLGTVPLQSLVTAHKDAMIAELVEPVVATVPPEMDQEEVGRILSRYNLTAVPVVDASSRLLGIVTFDDVIDVIEAESTEDILKFGGVSDEEELRGDWQGAVRSRLPWLVVNLGTAFAAAAVYAPFTETIQKMPVLAAWPTIVAGMGGNGATQALAVTVRRLALSRGVAGERGEIVTKEVTVGVANGLANGLIAGAIAAAFSVWWLHTGPMLGVVVLLAMWGNLVVAGLAGGFVPILLERFGVDPAIASSVVVTTFTDVGGFFLTLELASRLLL